MTNKIIVLAQNTSFDLSGYNNAKAIDFPFFDNFLIEIAKSCIIIGLGILCMILVFKYLQKRFKDLSMDEEKVTIIFRIGVISLVFGLLLLGTVKLILPI